MQLTISIRELKGVSVLRLEGRLAAGEASLALREALNSAMVAGKRNLVLDMAQVSMIDSAGLSTLLAAHHSAQSLGAEIKFASVAPKLVEVLQVAGLASILRLYDSEAAAISSFRE